MINADTDTERLIDVFHGTCCAAWTREQIAKDKLVRFAQTYLMMARAKYRPQAPSDGCGNIQLTKDEYNDQERLYREAVQYAAAFNREEDGHTGFHIGCSNWSTNRAFILAIEAARLTASGSDGDEYAVRLLELAIKEITAANGPATMRNRPATATKNHGCKTPLATILQPSKSRKAQPS